MNLSILKASMQEIYPSLNFTTEVGEGEGGWLPTLDIMIRVEGNNTISYRYFEKPTTSNTMIQKRTALNENSKNQILANDLVRRLANTDDRQPNSVKEAVLDQFARKALTSGYSVIQTRRIVLNGLRGWERKKLRRTQDGLRIFRTGKESLSSRIKKKTTAKTTWFRKKGRKNIQEFKLKDGHHATTPGGYD